MSRPFQKHSASGRDCGGILGGSTAATRPSHQADLRPVARALPQSRSSLVTLRSCHSGQCSQNKTEGSPPPAPLVCAHMYMLKALQNAVSIHTEGTKYIFNRKQN